MGWVIVGQKADLALFWHDTEKLVFTKLSFTTVLVGLLMSQVAILLCLAQIERMW